MFPAVIYPFGRRIVTRNSVGSAYVLQMNSKGRNTIRIDKVIMKSQPKAPYFALLYP